MFRTAFLVLISTLTFSFHQFHVGITQIEYKAESARLEVALKLATSDLENAIRLQGLKKPYLGETNEDLSVDSILSVYLKDQFVVKYNNDSNLDLHFIGKEIGIHDSWCYLEAVNIAPVDSIDITNTIFMNFIDLQTHKITFTNKGKVKSKMVSKIERNAVFIL